MDACFEERSMRIFVGKFLLFVRYLLEFSNEFISRTFTSMSRIVKSLIATFAVLILAIALSCSKPDATLETSDKTSTYSELVESIRRDLGISKSHTIEILYFESKWRDGGQNARESATILKSTDNNFQLSLIYRKPTSNHPAYRRWSNLLISTSSEDGDGDTIIFKREFVHRPTEEDIEAFKKWREEW